METDYSQVFVAKAQLVLEKSMRRQRAPKTRSELLDTVAIIRRRLRTGNDPILKSLGLSPAGIRHFMESEYGLARDEADLLASAAITLIESYNG